MQTITITLYPWMLAFALPIFLTLLLLYAIWDDLGDHHAFTGFFGIILMIWGTFYMGYWLGIQ